MKVKLEFGSITGLTNNNIAYIQTHKFKLTGNTYFFFNICYNIYNNKFVDL